MSLHVLPFGGINQYPTSSQEAEVLARLEASADDPLGLELSGHALLDMYPERRGNIFSDEVYRLTKAFDATTVFGRPGVDDGADGAQDESANDSNINYLPPNHKISTNDVIMLTLQPAGSGDFFGPSTLPTAKDATSVECRVLNTGPTYVDVAIPGGSFEAAFGPAPNNVGSTGRGDRNMRLRADRYFSNVPYERMVSALGQMTALPERAKQMPQKNGNNNNNNNKNAKKKEMDIQMDEVLRDAIVSTYRHGEEGADLEQPCDVGDLCRKLARPPLPNSLQLAKQALDFMQSDRAAQFPEFNEPQVTAIGAALTRRLTMIQGPPGTGKTLTAASIAFGFVHQCRNISPHTKVLACAFSNIGADNLAEYLIRLGLKVVRVGKASGVSESLWDYTLDAAIDRDPAARKAQEDATKATSNLRKFTSSKPSFKRGSSGQTKRGDVAIARAKREAATTAVKAAIEASNVAATKALREADVIVCTSVGAADARLLAACGIVTDEDEEIEADGRLKSSSSPSGKRVSPKPNGSSTSRDRRKLAPDNLPSLSTPFVIVDEACQSVEPANLIPITATNSCRSLVMLGDPCQLPPTVRGDVTGTGSSPLSVSLMSRLASTLHQPVIVTAQADKTLRDDRYLNALPTKQAVSLVRYKTRDSRAHVSYRKQYAGSLLLSVQYRMHPSISSFSSAVFYDGLLSTPAFLAEHRLFPPALNEMLPSAHPEVGVRFVDVGGRNNERKGEQSFSSPAQQVASATALGENTSYRNDAEAQEILLLLKDLLRAKNESSERESNAPPMSIGIVTPYSSQVALIKSLMAADAEFRSLAIQSSTVIEVQSVDGYQGRERDLIIFSAVRSNRQGRLGFLTDWRRMNVALTRAKSALVVFGDMETLRDGDRHWEAFADWCEKMGCVIDAGIDESEANEFM